VVHVAPQEFLGPSEEEDSEFARELAKMTTDTSAESRKVDKKTALAMWDNSVLPPAARKRRADVEDENGEEETDQSQKMVFTLVTKRGNKQQVSRT
jgi:regulator of nonsense transcripts 2